MNQKNIKRPYKHFVDNNLFQFFCKNLSRVLNFQKKVIKLMFSFEKKIRINLINFTLTEETELLRDKK